MRTKSAPWVVGTAFVALLILAAAWFLAISPRLDSAALKNEQTVGEQARVDQLEIQLAGLKADFENIDEFRADLAALRVQIPTETGDSDLVRRIQTLAQETGVASVLTVTPQSPVEVLPPAVDPAAAPVDPAAAAPVDGAATDGAATGEAATADPAAADPTTAVDPATGAPVADPATAGGVTGFYALPIEVSGIAGYEATLAFLDRLQALDSRLVLLSDVQLTAQKEEAASETRPATAAGDVEFRVTIYAFVLLDPTQAQVPADEPAEAPALPAPAGQPNPFVPLG